MVTGDQHSLGIRVAKRLSKARKNELPGIVSELQRRRQLSKAMRQINRLLESKKHAPLAKSALDQIGFGSHF